MIKLIIIIIMMTYSLSCFSGFTLNTSTGAAFEQDEVKINIADNCLNLGITSQQLLNLTVTGINRYWNKVPTTRLHLVAGTIQSLSSAYYDETICEDNTTSTCTPNPNLIIENDILISCNASELNFPDSDMNVIASTVPNNITGRVIHGALMIINDRVGNQFQKLTEEQKIIIIAHELGHAIGLGHTSNDAALMYYRLMDITRDNLSWEDVDGLTYLYPAHSPDLGTCGTIKDVNSNNNHNYLFTFICALIVTCIYLPINKRRPGLYHNE